MEKKKALYITTVSSTINAFLVPHIEMLNRKDYQVDIATNVTTNMDEKILEMGCKVYNVPFQRNPISRKNYKAYKIIKEILKNDYDFIHVHTPVASLVSRLGAIKQRKKGTKVIYTSHGFHFHEKSSIFSWAVYYTLEKILSLFTDAIITINCEDYYTAVNKIKNKNVYYMSGVGFDKSRTELLGDEEKNRIKIKNDIKTNDFVLISIGELNDNKNHRVIIESLNILKKNKGLNNFKYLICGEGPERNNLEGMIKEYGLENNVILKGHVKNINELLNISNVFLFPSQREGLGMAAIEAMSLGLPIITSNVHGINDYSEDGITGFKCDPRDVSCFKESIVKVYNHDNIEAISTANVNIASRYSISNSLEELERIYEEIINEL